MTKPEGEILNGIESIIEKHGNDPKTNTGEAVIHNFSLNSFHEYINTIIQHMFYTLTGIDSKNIVFEIDNYQITLSQSNNEGITNYSCLILDTMDSDNIEMSFPITQTNRLNRTVKFNGVEIYPSQNNTLDQQDSNKMIDMLKKLSVYLNKQKN